MNTNDPDYVQNIIPFENKKENLTHKERMDILRWSEEDFNSWCAAKGLHPDDDYQEITYQLEEQHAGIFWDWFNKLEE